VKRQEDDYGREYLINVKIRKLKPPKIRRAVTEILKRLGFSRSVKVAGETILHWPVLSHLSCTAKPPL
jgi:hypothetical protein